MSLITNWGYRLVDVSSLDDLLTSNEFDGFTANKFSGDARMLSNLSAASNAVRNYCGWHLFPSLNCEVEHTIQDYSFVERSGRDMIVQLPASYVTAVSSVLINAEYDSDNESWSGTACDYTFETNGLLIIYNVYPAQYDRSAKLVIDYTAGLPNSLMYAIKELIASKTTQALSSSFGINSESSGGVSITYSSNWVNSAKATALASDNKEVLQPYKVGGVY